MEEKENYYDILGISEESDSSAVVDVFRRLVKEHHPDLFSSREGKSGAEAFIKRVTEAYNTLSRPALRAKYDESLETRRRRSPKANAREQMEELLKQGKVRLDSGDLQGAITVYDHVLRLHPDNAEALFQAGMVRLKNPRWRVKGTEQVNEAMERNPFNSSFIVKYASFLLEHGQKLRAHRLLEKGSVEFPDNNDIKIMLGGIKNVKSSGSLKSGKK